MLRWDAIRTLFAMTEAEARRRVRVRVWRKGDGATVELPAARLADAGEPVALFSSVEYPQRRVTAVAPAPGLPGFFPGDFSCVNLLVDDVVASAATVDWTVKGGDEVVLVFDRPQSHQTGMVV